MNWTILKLIEWTADYFTNHGVPNPRLDAELLLAHTLKKKRIDLYLNFEQAVSERDLAIFKSYVQRRARREPLQYITGVQEFWGLPIKVTPAVMIPRQETEVVVETALKIMKTGSTKQDMENHASCLPGLPAAGGQASLVPSPFPLPSLSASARGGSAFGGSVVVAGGERAAEGRVRGGRTTSDERRATILDLCTGSGAIIAALASELPEARFTGVDISDAALEVASQNLERWKDRVNLLKGDLFLIPPIPPFPPEADQPLAEEKGGTNGTPPFEKGGRGGFDIIVSNPPYISEREYADLQPEVRDFEPKAAFLAGPDGLDFYRRIIEEAPNFLNSGGWLVLELGDGRAEEVANLIKTSGKFEEPEVTKDLNQLDRVLQTRLAERG